MVATTERSAVEPYLADFESFEKERSGREPSALGVLRRQARDRFAELGFPSMKEEEWRFTNVAPIARTELVRARAGEATPTEGQLQGFRFAGTQTLVFVDGFFRAELSDLQALPTGASVGGLAAGLEKAPEAILGHLGRHASFADHPFVAMNAAFFEDGAFIHLARGTVVESPIHLLFVSSVGAPARASFPRVLLVAEEASQASVVESYVTLGEGAHLTCAVTELVAGDGAVVDHYKLQQESLEAFHTGTFQIYQQRSSNVSSHAVSTGGALVRNDTNALLDAEGCECTLNGLYLAEGSQLVDNHMRMIHAKPHCNSYELYKGVLEGRARAVFNGRIFVAKGAQKTDAKQSNRNLLLSNEALVHSNPQLEIFADDVRCTHGSTVGQLDDDAIFYLRSRGIGEEAARSLLIYAFASDIVERIQVPSVRERLEEFLFRRLPQGDIVRQAV